MLGFMRYLSIVSVSLAIDDHQLFPFVEKQDIVATVLNCTSEMYSSLLKYFPPKCNIFGTFCCHQTAFSFGTTFPQQYKTMVLQAAFRV